VRVLLTGHHGYIGSVLVPMLGDAGHEVVGLSSTTTGAVGFEANANSTPLPPTCLITLGAAASPANSSDLRSRSRWNRRPWGWPVIPDRKKTANPRKTASERQL
jgi:NAD dependent epimerase/dehydratase family